MADEYGSDFITIVDEDGTETREYPHDRLFSHVVGYASHGKSGIDQIFK